MEVTAYYDSGEPVILESNEYNSSPSGALTSEDNKITVSYGDKKATTLITVNLVELTDLIIEKAPDKTEYVVGQSFSDAGMVVKAQYNNGAEHEISRYSYSPKDALTKIGTQDITISYTEEGITKVTIQQVKVIAKVVSSIEITKQPSQRSYIEGQKLSLSGLVVRLTYNDETSKEVSVDDFVDYGITTSIANGTVLSLDEHNGKAITITCEGIGTETESITVVAKTVTSMEIKNPPNKLSYTAGDALNLSGLIVTLIYNNGETTDVAYEDFETAGITVNCKDGDILTISDNSNSILVTYNEISVAAGKLSVTPQLYQITIGAGGTHQIGSKTPLLIICNGSLSDLTGVYVDGVQIDQANYTVKSGSTILTLNRDYLDGLTVGTHSLRLEYLYGSGETTFKVAEAKQAENDAKKTTTPENKNIAKVGTAKGISAKTGDTASVMIWVTLVLLSGIVISGSVWYRRKRRR